MQRLTWLQSLFLRRCHTPAYCGFTRSQRRGQHAGPTSSTTIFQASPVLWWRVYCFHHNFPFLSTYSFNSFAHGTPLVSGVRASRACMGTPGRPAAPRYRARANGIHYGTHSVPRLQLMGHIRFHRTEAPTSVNNYYSHYDLRKCGYLGFPKFVQTVPRHVARRKMRRSIKVKVLPRTFC